MQRASEYTIEARERPVLCIQLYKKDTATRLGDSAHPWHALFEQSDTQQSGRPNSCGPPLVQDQAVNNNSQAQKDITVTVCSAATCNTTETLCHLSNDQSRQHTNAFSACSAVCVDEINTQGLLDGLEDLYDFGDENMRSNEACNVAKKDSVDINNTVDDNSCLDNLDDMNPDEAEAIINQLGAFESAKASLDYKADSQVKEANRALNGGLPPDSSKRRTSAGALDTLVDMSDGEAERIVNSLGGFSKPPQVFSKSGSSLAKGPHSSSSHSDRTEHGPFDTKTQLQEIPEMDDAEARCIIKSLGGFARALSQSEDGVVATSFSAKMAVTTAALQSPSIHKMCSLSPGMPPPPVPCIDQGIVIQATPSQFPSKQDVLSARRALKIDGRKTQMPPSFNTPVKMGDGRPMTPALGKSAREIMQVLESKRRLAFKLPGVKRPAAKLRFNSPTKRLALDNGQMGSGQEVASSGVRHCRGGNSDGDCRPTIQLIQFSQPFRSPAKTNQNNSCNREANQHLLKRVRAPPVLPPVTPKRHTALPSVSLSSTHLQAHGSERALALSSPRQHYNLKSIAGLLAGKGLQEVPKDAVRMTSGMAMSYRFQSEVPGQNWGAEEARQAMLAHGCDPSTTTRAWVQNHFRWIVWTGACFARRIPSRWREFWSIERTLERLLYRHRREIDGSERSALRRIIEKDSAPQQLMVLCVASVEYRGSATLIEVTDGWYSVGAQIDAILAQAIHNGRLRAGDKVACAGVGVDGLSEGVQPLSMESEAVFLVLNANCVRRAHWDAKLGFQQGRTMSMSLSAVHTQGGAVGATLDVVVMRRYPMLFMETTASGRRIIRSEKEEERVLLRFEDERAGRMQELLEQHRTLRIAGHRGVQSRPALAQSSSLDELITKMNEEDEAAVIEVIDKEMPRRQVHGLLRMLVCDYPAHKFKHSETRTGRLAMVTIWRPRNIAPDDIPEGSRLLITGAVVSPYRASVHAAVPLLHLNFSSSSGRLRPMTADARVVAQTEYRERGVLHVDELQHVKTKQEVDITGNVDSYSAEPDGRRSVLRLQSADDHGVKHYADIEFSADVFGSICPQAGSTVTVRNCQYALQLGSSTQEFRLHADDTAEFVF